MTLTKAKMVQHLVDEIDLNKPEAKQLIETFLEEIRSTLERGENVKLAGLGNFTLLDKKQRPGRNPKSGEKVPVSARRVVTFRTGQKLKLRVKNYVGNIE